MTVGAGSTMVMNVAGVDVAQTILDRDLPRTRQGRRRSGRTIHHLEVRMERGEVQGNVDAEIRGDPLRHFLEFLLGIIGSGNDEIRYLKPHVGFVLQIAERVLYGVEISGADFAVE